MSTARVSRERLDRELACRGWNANDLAHAAGVSAATISGARRGGRIAPRTLRKIVLALTGVPVIPGVAEILEPGAEGPVAGSVPAQEGGSSPAARITR